MTDETKIFDNAMFCFEVESGEISRRGTVSGKQLYEIMKDRLLNDPEIIVKLANEVQQIYNERL